MRSQITFRQRAILLVLIILVLFVLSACKRKQTLAQTTSTEKHTEKESGVTPRDTNVTVPGSQVSGSVPLPPPGTDLPADTVRSDRAWSTVQVSNGRIDHSGGCDTATYAVQLYDRWSRQLKAEVVVKETTDIRTVEVRVMPKWVWWALLFGLAGMLRLLWPLIVKVIKIIKVFKPF